VAVAISYAGCAPYLSTTLLRIDSKVAPNVSAIRAAIVDQLNKHSGKDRTMRRRIHKADPPTFKQGAVDVAWIHYSEVRAPAWYLRDDLQEEQHHVIFVAHKKGLVALTFSDSSLRSSIIVEVRKHRSAPF
jgi:hypothetical protein